DASDDIAGAWIDFNQNGKKDTNAAIDFYVEGLLPNVITINLIPESINDWEQLTLKAGYICGVSSKTTKAASITEVKASAASEISFDISNAVQEISLEEAEERGLLYNPGDCEVSSVMPDVLYTGVNNQRVKLTVRNMFDTETTAHLQVTSDLLASVYSSDIKFAASADKIIELTVPSSALTAGKHALTYTLTCANEEVKSGTTEIEVQAVKPIVLKVGESETLTGTAVRAYALSVEDTAIATIEGSTVYAIETGKTFIILKDLESDRTVCSLPIYVTETGELNPEDVADDTGTTDPTDPDGTTGQATSSSGSSGGCNSGFGLAALSVIALAVFKRR
ncbi:MAG: SYNERG-CTERM sorting domain-containing protein, partial [Synergistaceae bacterium]|nr:SYNERG-CTERM sorting domain-containing protein [Synergistaceae bacterium]